MKKIIFGLFVLGVIGCWREKVVVEPPQKEVIVVPQKREININLYPWWNVWAHEYPPPAGHEWYRTCPPEYRHFEHENHEHRR